MFPIKNFVDSSLKIITATAFSLGVIISLPIGVEANYQQIETLNFLHMEAENLLLQATSLASSPRFKIGENVSIVTGVNVYGGTTKIDKIIGAQKKQQVGKILSGPLTQSGNIWWKVNFSTGVDGWVTQSWLYSQDSTGAPAVQGEFFSLPVDQKVIVSAGVKDEKVGKAFIPQANIDRLVKSAKLTFSIEDSTNVSRPWLSFKDVSIWSNGKKIWSKDVSEPASWTQAIPSVNGENTYEINVFTGLQKIAAGKEYPLEIKVSIQKQIAGSEKWKIGIPVKGLIVNSKLTGDANFGFVGNKIEVSIVNRCVNLGKIYPDGSKLKAITVAGKIITSTTSPYVCRNGLWKIEVVEPGYDIIVIAGQSNAVGANTPKVDTFVDLPLFTSHADKIFQVGRNGTSNFKIIPAVEPLDHWSLWPESKGFGYSFALRYAQQNPTRKVLLIPAARGGVTIRLWDKKVDQFDWFGKADSTELYDDMLKRVQIGLKTPGSKVVAVLWQQGEADVNVLAENHPELYPFISEGLPGYNKKLTELRQSFRTDLKSPCLPFLAGEMPPAWTAVAPTGRHYLTKLKINEQIKLVMDNDSCRTSAFIPSAGAVSNPGSSSKAPDAVLGGSAHFSAMGQYTMAKNYFSAFKLLNK